MNFDQLREELMGAIEFINDIARDVYGLELPKDEYSESDIIDIIISEETRIYFK